MRQIERLYLPGGKEHPIAMPQQPITPEENTIVFPDKKKYEVSWRTNFDALTKVQQSVEKAEIVQEEGTYRIPLDNPDLGYAMMVAFSDAHILSYTTDHDLVKKVVDTVINTPNTCLGDCGDTFNNGIWGGLGYEDVFPPYMQAFTVEDMMREVGKKWAFTVLGNHTEWMFNAAGQKPEQIFARHLEGPVFAGMGVLHFQAGEQRYDIAAAHTYWGKSKKNIFNCCVNLRQNEYPEADVFIIGHEHVLGWMTEFVNGETKVYVRPGTAKTKDRYARIHGIARRGQPMGAAIIFGTKERSIEVKPIYEAEELMTLRDKISRLPNEG